MKPTAAIALASYNILADRYGNGWVVRRASVNRFVAETSPDILALQEATQNQLADVIRANPKYSAWAGERSDGMRGDQPWYEYNPILFDPHRFELVLASSFWVSGNPDVPGSILAGTKKHGRVLTWVQLKDRLTGTIILVANIHVHGLRGSDEVEIVEQQLSKVQHVGPVVFLGDFNAEPAGKAYAWMTNAPSLFRDAASGFASENLGTLIGPNGATVDGGKDGAKIRNVTEVSRIDYVFTCGFPRPTSYDVVSNQIGTANLHASDHLPVVVHFSGPFDTKVKCL